VNEYINYSMYLKSYFLLINVTEGSTFFQLYLPSAIMSICKILINLVELCIIKFDQQLINLLYIKKNNNHPLIVP